MNMEANPTLPTMQGVQVVPSADIPSYMPVSQPCLGAEKKLTSRYRGVCWNRKNRRWQAAINRAGQYIYLGSFVSEVDAARAFDRAAVKLRGHSTKINFDFADYKDELIWHEQIHKAGGATEAILRDPKILRSKSDKPGYFLPMGTTVAAAAAAAIAGNPPTSPNHPHHLPQHHPQQARRPSYATHFTDGYMDSGVPRVIAQHQSQRLMMSLPLACLNLPEQRLPHSNMPIVGLTGGATMQPPSHPTHGAGAMGVATHTINVRPNETPSGETNVVNTTQPLLNMPSGSTPTHFFQGSSNCFALAYLRNDKCGTTVLVFDGKSVREAGVFSTTEDAIQACKSLLNIIEKLQTAAPETHPSTIPAPTRDHFPPNMQQQTHPEPHQQPQPQPQLQPQPQQQDEQIMNRQQVDLLPSKSPFEVKPGCEPEGLSGANEQRWYSHSKGIELSSTSARKHSEEGTGASVSAAMGSLLNTSTDQRDCLHKCPFLTSVPQVPKNRSLDVPNEPPMTISSNGITMLSQSLENLMSILNQSAQLGLVKKEGEGEEEDGGSISLVNHPSIDLRVEEKKVTFNALPSGINSSTTSPFFGQFHQNAADETDKMFNTVSRVSAAGPTNATTKIAEDSAMLGGKRRPENFQIHEITKKARAGSSL